MFSDSASFRRISGEVARDMERQRELDDLVRRRATVDRRRPLSPAVSASRATRPASRPEWVGTRLESARRPLSPATSRRNAPPFVPSLANPYFRSSYANGAFARVDAQRSPLPPTGVCPTNGARDSRRISPQRPPQVLSRWRDWAHPDVDRMSYEELLALQDRIGYVRIGVPDEVLRRFPVCNVLTPPPLSADPCSICLEPAQIGDRLRCLPCEHSFHVHCVDPWLSEHKHCPMCKRDVTVL